MTIDFTKVAQLILSESPDFFVAALPLFGGWLEEGIHREIAEDVALSDDRARKSLANNVDYIVTLATSAVSLFTIMLKLIAVGENLSPIRRLVIIAALCGGAIVVGWIWNKGREGFITLESWKKWGLRLFPLALQIVKCLPGIDFSS